MKMGDLTMGQSRMFPFITKTWNPLGGRCPHGCSYCWSMGEGGLVERNEWEKYQGEPRLIEKELKPNFKENDFVFVCSMTDLFADRVPDELILKLFEVIMNHHHTEFLLLTKNPSRYLHFLDWQFAPSYIPDNCTLGATIETNRPNYISGGPFSIHRYIAMDDLKEQTSVYPLFVSVEPVMAYDFEIFLEWLVKLELWGLAYGYDNYNHGLPEPSLAETNYFLDEFHKRSPRTRIYKKTLRKGWTEELVVKT